jgi:hypothetical protein
MKQYNPLRAPDPAEWLAIDEGERILLAEEYHRRARIRLPRVKLHAVMHVAVENQVALGDEIPVRRTLQRLMAEGLDRHDAIHAIGLVLVEFMNDLVKQSHAGVERRPDSNQAYCIALEGLTAESWRQSG